jgi:hypothetical protein
MHDFKHIIALVLFGAGAVLGIAKLTPYAVACASAGLFVVEL